jgi:hypothetical protein
MRGQLRDQRNRAVHVRQDHAIAGTQIGTDEADNGGQGVFTRLGYGRTAWFKDTGDAGQRVLPGLQNALHIGRVQTGSSGTVQPEDVGALWQRFNPHSRLMRIWAEVRIDAAFSEAALPVARGRRSPHDCEMRVLITSNDIVRLSFLSALLTDAGIEAVLLDNHTSILEGSVGAIPRRLVVHADAYDRACRILRSAGEW